MGKHEKLHMLDGADCSRGRSWSTDRNESIGESSLPRPLVPFFERFGNAALISSHHQCLLYLTLYHQLPRSRYGYPVLPISRTSNDDLLSTSLCREC